MKIKTRKGVVLFVLPILVLSIAATNVANYMLLPEELFRDTIVVGTSIAVCISIPISSFVGIKLLELSNARTQLQRLVDEDRLTGVATRACFFGTLNAQDELAGITLMVDIDHFKSVNDNLGHFAGDEVLRSVANVMKNSVRKNDIVGRFGGEEFSIFLDGIDVVNGAAIAERVRSSIEEASIYVEGKPVPVTTSIGGAIKYPDMSLDESLKRADRSLYVAKTSGRNRVCFFEDQIQQNDTDGTEPSDTEPSDEGARTSVTRQAS